MTSVAVAAPHGLAVEAAAEAIGAGGNALDAALAAAATLVVVYPHQCSLGGDLSALVRQPDGSVAVVLSLGAAAAAIDVERIRAAGAGMPRQGPLAVTVPGVVAGWIELAELGSALGLARPLRAAATLAERAPVSAGLARAIAARLDAVTADPGLRSVFLPLGQPACGSFAQSALAQTLSALADHPEGFYRGAVARRLAVGLADLGSPITAEDLAAHRVERPQPLTLRTGNAEQPLTWWAPPPPAQGATALALLDPSQEGDLLERARAAQAARDRLLGDPRGGEIDVDGLLRPTTATGVAVGAATRAAGDTVAVTAVDDEGRSVVLIQSVFQTFGAGLLEQETGIVLHNRGGAFVVLDDPEAHARHPARLQAGLRPPHTLCPLLAEGPRVRVALGCQGGRAQPLILAQVAAETVDPSVDLTSALAAPRWVVGDRDLDFPSETVLAEAGSEFPPRGGVPLAITAGGDDRCGHVQVARIWAAGMRNGSHGSGRLEAAADPRADGRAIILSNSSMESRR